MQTGANTAKKIRLRTLIFGHKYLSRQQLIAMSGLNERSVIRYTKEFCEAKLISEEQQTGVKGRPAIFYRSNCDRIYFMGVMYTAGALVIGAVDINGCPIALRHSVVELKNSNSEVLQKIFAEIEQMNLSLPDYNLSGISCTVDAFQKPLPDFESAAERRYKVPVTICDGDVSLLRRFRQTLLLEGSIGGIYSGSEYGVIVLDPDGEVRRNSGKIADKIRHLPLLPESGLRCYCGRQGCVGVALTYSGTVNRYFRELGGVEPDNDMTNIYNYIHMRAALNDATAQRTIEANGRAQGRIAALLQKELHLDNIVLMHTKDIIRKYAVEQYNSLRGGDAPELLCCNSIYAERVFAGIDDMRLKFLNFENSNI